MPKKPFTQPTNKVPIEFELDMYNSLRTLSFDTKKPMAHHVRAAVGQYLNPDTRIKEAISIFEGAAGRLIKEGDPKGEAYQDAADYLKTLLG